MKWSTNRKGIHRSRSDGPKPLKSGLGLPGIMAVGIPVAPEQSLVAESLVAEVSNVFPAGTRMRFRQQEPPHGWRLLERYPDRTILCEITDDPA